MGERQGVCAAIRERDGKGVQGVGVVERVRRPGLFLAWTNAMGGGGDGMGNAIRLSCFTA